MLVKSKKKLGDIINLKRGYDLPASMRMSGTVPVISSSGISGYHSEGKAKGEGVVIGRYGTLGEPHYFHGTYWPHNTSLYVTDFKGNLPKYVYYLFKCLGNIKTADKSAVPGVNRNDLHLLTVPYICKEKQKDSIRLLSQIDEKINLNNRINAELESLAKLIYDYWFVQFDFPDENGRPYKSSGGKMVYNEALKREIPEGWRQDLVGNLIRKISNSNKIPANLVLNKGNIPVIDQSSDYICGYTNDTEALIEINEPHVIFGDHTRRLKLINFDYARGADGTQVLISDSRSAPQHFFYHTLSKIDLSNYGYARHYKFLKQHRIIIPKQEVALNFECKIKPLYDMIRVNIFENIHLVELRDWLLPLLMNGQVRVGE